MSRPDREDLFDQFLIRNQGGLRLVARSVQDDGLESRLLATVEPFIRLKRSSDGERAPGMALSYFFMNRHEVAVLARFYDPDGSPGRNPSRVLVGAAATLTVPVALGLHVWDGWRQYVADGQTSLNQLSWSELRAAAEAAAPALHKQALFDYRDLLVPVLARIMQQPALPLRVAGCPQQACLPLIWGLHHVAAQELLGRGVVRDWSFSSYETQEKAGLPANVFMPVLPVGSPEGRLRVDLRADPLAPERYVDYANRLVDKALGHRVAGEAGGRMSSIPVRRPESGRSPSALPPTVTSDGDPSAGSGTSEARVDQLLMAFWGGSLRVVDSSTSDEDLRSRVLGAVEPFVRLSPGPDGERPDMALSYFEIGPRETAVVARFADRHPARVLVGPPEVLSVELALGLSTWSGWRRGEAPDEPPARLSSSELRREAEEAEPELRRMALVECRSILVTVLARLAQRRLQPLRVVGCPPRAGAAVMWALRHVADADFRSRNAYRSWTFSTYETQVRADMPENVFLPAVPADAGPGVWVDLTTDQVIDQRWRDHAEKLVDEALGTEQGANAGPGQLLPVRGASTMPSAVHGPPMRERRKDTPVDPQAEDDGGVKQRVSAAPTRQPEPARRSTGDDVIPKVTQTADAPKRSISGTPSRTAGGGEPAALRSAGRGRMLGTILSAGSEQSYRLALSSMLAQAPPPKVLREQIQPTGIGEIVSATVTLVADTAVRDEVYDQWLALLFGKDMAELRDGGDDDPLQFASAVVQTCRSDQFVDRLLHGVKRAFGGYDPLAGSIAHRYLVAHGERDLPAIAGNVAGQHDTRPTSRAQHLWIPVVLAALLLVGLGAFLLGRFTAPASTFYLVPTPTTPTPTVVQPAPTTGATTGAYPLPAAFVVSLSASNALKPGEGVFLLLESVDGQALFLDSACVPEPAGTTWTCTPVGPAAAVGEVGRQSVELAVAGDTTALTNQVGERFLRSELNGRPVPDGMRLIPLG